MDTLLKDIRFGARMLVRNAGSSFISAIALALGIGLTVMAFSIVWGGVLKGLPFEEQDDLVMIYRTNLSEGSDRMGVTIHDYEDWRAQQQSFTDLAAFYGGTINVSGTDRPERYSGAFVSASMFDVLRTNAFMGRVFTEDDQRIGAAPVAILSYATWRERFGADPDVIGRVVRVNAIASTIVGVMPQGFGGFPLNVQVWVPLQLDAASIPRGSEMQLTVMGRLQDGVSADRAAAEMATIARRIEAEYPETNEGISTGVRPYIEGDYGDDVMVMLYTMLGAVFMVLLIACANVANLLIARAAARSREVGIRTAMGASGIRIVRQFLTESLILSLSGAVVGTGIAVVGMRMFNASIAHTNPPSWIDIRLDGTVVLFVVAITLLAALLSGAIPAWQAARANASDVLKDESRGASSFRLGRISRALVVAEIALSAGLLVGAGLMVKSVTRIRTVDFAFATDVFTARIGLPEAQYPDSTSQRRFFEELQPHLRAVSGIENIGLIQALPATGSPDGRFAVEGATYVDDRDHPVANILLAGPGVFDALDVSVTGRVFTDIDVAGALPVAIVNESLVRRFFAGQDPIGRRVRAGDSDSNEPWRTIIGVVPDMYVSGLDDDDDMPQAIYTPIAQGSARFMSVIASARGADPMTLTQGVRDAVLAVDADLPIYFVETLRTSINTDNWFYMVFGTLFMVFGGAALFLAAVGLYGVMATSVRQRTREMGVRMALGAQAGDVRGLVLRQGMIQLAIGLVLGLALALGVSQLLQMLLFEVNPRDPSIFLAIGAVLTTTATAACMVPAIRATRVDPMYALRVD